MAKLKNHPEFELRDDAAAAFDRYETDNGEIRVTSAKRTVEQQQKLIDRWDKGGPGNRPPALYPPARPATTSNHVKNGGIAVDTPDWRKFAVEAADYGFSHPYPGGDPVHFEYVGVKEAENQSGVKTETTLARQKFINDLDILAEPLVEDGRLGPKTRAAYRTYQELLKTRGLYTGQIDGVWGPLTEKAHDAFVESMKPPAPVTPTPQPSSGVPEGLRWFGIQEMLRALYGYRGAIDNIPGPQTISALQRFLKANGYVPGPIDGLWGVRTSKAVQRWLQKRWGYRGQIDNIWGDGTRSAWARAESANGAAY